MLSFSNLHKNRKKLVFENKDKDHIILQGQNNIVLSAPHGVSQVRLGKFKFKEIGSLTTALYLHNQTGCGLIAKTRNNNDDANFDEECLYRKKLGEYIENHKIKYLIDFHGLAAKRGCDVNLGVHLGKNISSDNKVFEELYSELTAGGFKVEIDNPFMGGSRTISGSFRNKYPKLWTIQIEINCSITNQEKNFDRYKKLLNIFQNWLEKID